MKDFEKLIISVFNNYEDEYGIEGVIEELFPGVSAGELVLDMYNAGLIPEDVIERFLNDE